MGDNTKLNADFLQKKRMGFLERYLSLWVGLCMIVGVLVEVPVMLSVCSFCNRTRHWFPGVLPAEKLRLTLAVYRKSSKLDSRRYANRPSTLHFLHADCWGRQFELFACRTEWNTTGD